MRLLKFLPKREALRKDISVPSSVSTTDLTFNPTVFEGNNVGEIILNNENGLSFDVASSAFVAPVGSYRTLLEVRYKTEVDVQVAAKMSTAYNPYIAYPVGGFYASPDEWKTIHFDLTNVINSYHSTSSNYTEMTLVFSGVGEQDQEKRVEIDDIKVVYIKTA